MTGAVLGTGRASLRVTTVVRSGDPRTGKLELTTPGLTVRVAGDGPGDAVPVGKPVSEEDAALWRHARPLLEIRAKAPGSRLPDHLLAQGGEPGSSAG